MIRFLGAVGTLLFLASCGTDGAPTRPEAAPEKIEEEQNTEETEVAVS